MLQFYGGSNSIVDFVFGHFSSSFIFWSTSFIVFLCIFCHNFLWKIQDQVIFSFESQENFFWRHNINHLDLVYKSYWKILPLFVFKDIQMRQIRLYFDQKYFDNFYRTSIPQVHCKLEWNNSCQYCYNNHNQNLHYSLIWKNLFLRRF